MASRVTKVELPGLTSAVRRGDTSHPHRIAEGVNIYDVRPKQGLMARRNFLKRATLAGAAAGAAPMALYAAFGAPLRLEDGSLGGVLGTLGAKILLPVGVFFFLLPFALVISFASSLVFGSLLWTVVAGSSRRTR